MTSAASHPELSCDAPGGAAAVNSEDRLISTDQYGPTLADFLQSHSEEALYRASQLSREFVESGMGPEEIIALHFERLSSITAAMPYREQARAAGDAHTFLLEVMIAYGVRYKEFLELKLGDRVHAAETRALQGEERVFEAEDVLQTIAHELGTPLAAAKGNADLAARMLQRGDVVLAAELVANAQEALTRIARLTADLVEASRGETPQPIKSLVDVSAAIDKAASWARTVAAAKGVGLAVEARQPGLGITANEDALLSIFGNLLSNAIRYTAPGGRVTIRLGQGPGSVWVEVEDTGIGMSEDVRKCIFAKFYRAPEARSMEAGGLGLGLPLVLRLVQAHGGQIEVESRPGKGSTFRILLPS